MGSSSGHVLTATGPDLEAQQHSSNWLFKHKYLLRPNQEIGVNKLGFCILKLPEDDRQPPQEFTPVGWRFGLHNRENMDTTGSEALKLSVAVVFGLVGEKWDDLCTAVVDDPKSMLTCYGLQEEITIGSWNDAEIKHALALDALFLAADYDRCAFHENERQLWTAGVKNNSRNTESTMFNSRYKSWGRVVQLDICKIESQIPLVIIQRVIDYFRKHATSQLEDYGQVMSDANYRKLHRDYEKKWIEHAMREGINCFMDISSDSFKNHRMPYCLLKNNHILGAAYEAICGPEDTLMSRNEGNEYVHIPSATKLKHSGINFIGVAGPLWKMSYEKNSLSVPKMRMYENTISLLLNMARYEENHVLDGCMLHDYLLLMINLIETPHDLEILIECGVIVNGCRIPAFSKWNALGKGLVFVTSSKKHQDMKVGIEERCNRRRHRLWSEFRTQFCSRPWYVLSAITIVMVTVSTLIQTYVAIIGSKRMKPQFP